MARGSVIGGANVSRRGGAAQRSVAWLFALALERHLIVEKQARRPRYTHRVVVDLRPSPPERHRPILLRPFFAPLAFRPRSLHVCRQQRSSVPRPVRRRFHRATRRSILPPASRWQIPTRITPSLAHRAADPPEPRSILSLAHADAHPVHPAALVQCRFNVQPCGVGLE